MDFYFVENNISYPVNIKVSKMTEADNLNCKLGIYYALTGKIPPFENGVSWEIYFKMLKENLATNDKDYYFLIVNKNNTKDIFATSLKCLESIQANGDNLPFQANWNNNRQITPRDFETAKEFLLSTLGESLKKRAERYLQFKQYFPNILPNLEIHIRCYRCNTFLHFPFNFPPIKPAYNYRCHSCHCTYSVYHYDDNHHICIIENY